MPFFFSISSGHKNSKKSVISLCELTENDIRKTNNKKFSEIILFAFQKFWNDILITQTKENLRKDLKNWTW